VVVLLLFLVYLPVYSRLDFLQLLFFLLFLYWFGVLLVRYLGLDVVSLASLRFMVAQVTVNREIAVIKRVFDLGLQNLVQEGPLVLVILNQR
jgi:hypothetical protein